MNGSRGKARGTRGQRGSAMVMLPLRNTGSPVRFRIEGSRRRQDLFVSVLCQEVDRGSPEKIAFLLEPLSNRTGLQSL